MAYPELSARALARQERFILLSTLSVITGLLWWLLANSHSLHTMTHGDMGTQLLSGFLFWLLMMIAMMLPPVLPWIWFYAAATKDSSDKPVDWGRTLLFSSGYFTLWGMFSLLAAGAQIGLHSWGNYSHIGLVLAPPLSGTLLCLAGLYQFSTLKRACLNHCRSPLSYFLSHWQEGPAGAFQLGLGHGINCLGCCWALMTLSFALGTMNLLWMGLVVLVLCGEKIAPGGELLSRLVGAGLFLWGVVIIWGAI